MNTKEFLADPSFWEERYKEGLKHTDPKIRDILTPMVIRDAVRCADGFVMSVQYSEYHYCNGREPFMGGDMVDRSNPPEPKSVEIGFPSEREPLLKEYAEEWTAPLFGDAYRQPWGSWAYKWRAFMAKHFAWLAKDNSTKTVYAWVPLEVVDAVLAKHGGIVGKAFDDEPVS